MNTAEFWKNYKMNEELDIAGSFIFDGIRTLDEIDNFTNSQDIFMFFYQISVGIERLLKIAIILIEHKEEDCVKCLMKKLRHHDHNKLLEILESKLKVKNSCKDFIKILSNFYKSNRYGRFEIFNSADTEKDILKKYLKKILPKGENIDEYFEGTSGRGSKVPQKVKNLLGNIIEKISTSLYEKIQTECSRLNLFTYETRSCSKAQKIFLNKTLNFQQEHLLSRELLIFLFNKKDDELLEEIKKIKPLYFDIDNISDVFKCFDSGLKKQFYLSGMQEMQYDAEDKKSRLNFLGNI